MLNCLISLSDGPAESNPKIKDLFSRLAGADGEIDSEELQDMLTASFSKSVYLISLTCIASVGTMAEIAAITVLCFPLQICLVQYFLLMPADQ